MLLTAIMLAAAAWTDMVLIPRVQDAQRALGSPSAGVADADTRRIEFGRIHRRSTLLQLVPLLGGLALLFYELKD
jgi:hypothetical protein